MVNWEKRTITGKSGKVYYIEPDKISVGRFAEYEVLSLMLAFNSDFKTYYTKLTTIGQKIRNVEKFGQLIDIDKDVNDLIAGIGNYTENSAPKIIRYCALFCNLKDEDRSTFTDEQVREKYEDWKDIDIADFFLLVSKVIPFFQEAYRVVTKKEKE